jgi:hypothetical protein
MGNVHDRVLISAVRVGLGFYDSGCDRPDYSL